MMRKIMFGVALAAFGSVTAAGAGTITITAGSGTNFDAFDNNAPGSTSGTTDTVFGLATWSTTPGTGPQTSQVTDTSVSSRDLAPLGDTTNFVFAQEGGSVTVSYAADLKDNSVTIYWGSPDTFNTVTLSNGDSITGSQMAAMLHFSANGLNSNSQWITITDTTPFKSFTASSSQPAFEFDMAGAVPEPSTWAMLMLGFTGLGYAAFRRSAKDRLSVKPI
jgi:PEP-CTERM motif